VHDRRGFTLVETVVALALMLTVSVSVSLALVASRAIAVRDRDQAIGRVAAQARLTSLTSLAFRTVAASDGSALTITDTTTDVSGDPPGPGGTGLGESPVGALWRDTSGYADYLDGAGRDLGAAAGARERAAYVRRWTISRQGAGAGEVVTMAVLVAPVSTAAQAEAADPTRVIDRPGVVLLRGARVRQAS
jgi:type II secretory pathway pseudopilin PulG